MQNKLFLYFIITNILLLNNNTALAIGGPLGQLDIASMLFKLREVIPYLTSLILIISYVAGIGMLFRGLGMLKIFGMPLTQTSRSGEFAGPLVYIVIGSVLLYVPSATNIISNTFFAPGPNNLFNNNPNGIAYEQNASGKLMGYVRGGNEWENVIDTCVMYIQLIGFIAFIRGWFILSHAGQPGVQPGTLSKGIIHLVGGILAINFVPLMSAIGNTIL